MRSVKQPPMSRISADDFQSPRYSLTPLIPFLKLNKFKVIWECAEGKGNLSNELRSKGFLVIGSDIKSNPKHDFLTWTPDQFDCIITNPPYSLKEKFIERCYKLGKPFALLLPLTALESEKRQKFYRKYGVQLIIPNKRIDFDTPSGQGSGSWFCTMWLTWGLNLPKDINFVEIQKDDKRYRDLKKTPQNQPQLNLMDF